MVESVTSYAVVSLIFLGMLVPASLTSNFRSWASFLSCSNLLLVAHCDVSRTVIESITPRKFGCILVSLCTAYEGLCVALMLLFQGTIVSSVSFLDAIYNDCLGTPSSK